MCSAMLPTVRLLGRHFAAPKINDAALELSRLPATAVIEKDFTRTDIRVLESNARLSRGTASLRAIA